MIRKMMILAVLGLALCLGIGTNVYAYIEVTGTVAKDPDVFAEFTPGWNTSTVDVQNTSVNLSNVGQNISDRSFIRSTGRITGTLTSSSGLEGRVAGNETFADDSVVHTGWGLVSFGDGLRLYILGAPVAPGNTNASITKNAPHNPFLFGTEDDNAGGNGHHYGWENGDSNVTDDGNSNVTGAVSPTSVPEPTTLLLIGIGLVGVAVVKRKFNK